MAEVEVACVVGNGTFVLTPEEWPIVVVLEVVWLTEENARSYVARNEREVSTVVAVEDVLRTSSANGCHE